MEAQPLNNDTPVQHPFKKRHVWGAIIFSYLCPGLGHLYSGKVNKAIFFYASYIIVTYSVLAWLKFTSNIYALLVFFLVPVPYFIYIIVNAVKTAKSEKAYTLKRYNRWYIYLAIIFIETYIISFPLQLLSPRTFSTPTGSMMNTVLIGEKFLANDLAYGIYSPFENKYLIRFSGPKRGDVVSFHFPGFRDEVNPEEEVLYLKRIIGVPCDTIEIKKGNIYINNLHYPHPGTSIVESRLDYRDKPDHNIFPKGSGWNASNYGPLIVPKQGDVLDLRPDNIEKWKIFIEREGNKIETPGSKILVNGIESGTYIVKRNYYFVMGDNFYNALDSRYWGFVPEDYIINKLTMIYWSWDNTIPFSLLFRLIGSIRWDRIGKIIE